MKMLSRLFIVAFLACILETSAWGEDGWGNSGAMPMPVKDSMRANHWWWPKTPSPDSSRNDVWGNGGLVYANYSEPPPPRPTPPPAAAQLPAASPPPVVERSVPVLNSVLFGFDRFELNDAGRSEIAQVVKLLRENSSDTVVIEGHTDDVNRSGNPEYNRILGQRRADSVRDVMLEMGLAAKRVAAESHGENDPALSNTSGANRAKNRRVVFVYSIED